MSEPTEPSVHEPLTSLVIVTYNGREWLIPCLESVFALDYPPDRLEVLVVDNGSSDGSAEAVRERFPQVVWLTNEVNNYCRANNLAVSRAKGAAIGFLNNDVRLDRRWLRELLSALFAEERTGAVGGKVLLRDGVLNSAGHVELPHGVWADRGHQEPDIGQFEVGGKVEGLSGSAVLYRRGCLEDVGPFDEDFHMYYEDVDLVHRCRQRGWGFVYVPSALAHHAFHGTASEGFVEQQIGRNRLLFLAKHAPERLAAAVSLGDPSDPMRGRGALAVLRDLPAVANKLIKHHGVDGLARWLPGIAGELEKLVQRERHFLASELSRGRKELDELQRAIEQRRWDHAQAAARADDRHTTLQQHDRLWEKIANQERQIGSLSQEVAYKDSWVRHHERMLEARSRELGELEQRLREQEAIRSAREATLAQRDQALLEQEQRLQVSERERQELVSRMHEAVNQLQDTISQRDETINQLEHEHTAKVQTIEVLERMLVERDAWLAQREQVRQELEHAHAKQDQRIHELEQELAYRERELSARGIALDDEREAHQGVRRELEAVYGSTAFRFLVRPLWDALVILRRPLQAAFGWRRRRILVVKPFHVSAADAVRAVEDLQARWPNARLTFLANVFPYERPQLQRMAGVERLWLYGPGFRPRTASGLFSLCWRAQWAGFAEGILLIGPPVPGAYRKGSLFLASVTPQVTFYHVAGATLASSYSDPAAPVKAKAFRQIGRVTALAQAAGWWFGFYALALLFIALVWWPVRLRRMMRRR
jgi:GT2 family glycosyltransferase